MPFVQVNDVKLHYEMEGSGPPLLMVAGTGLPGATWRTGPSAQYAAEGFTVITFDHRGTGSSDKPDVDYSTAGRRCSRSVLRRERRAGEASDLFC